MIDGHELNHPREEERLEALRGVQILDTPIEERFERITRLASKALDVPVCAISCIDHHRQWFKSIQGLDLAQTARCVSFCQHTILQDDVMVIPDARSDPRFGTNPLVTDDPGIVFYAGVPILSRNKLPIATLCAIDYEPRNFQPEDLQTLREFARLVERELETPRESVVEDALIQQVGEAWRSSLLDPLTRVWNHEGISLLITESVRNLSRNSEHSMGVATIELLGYNHVCKEHGYVQGDKYLRRFMREALKCLQPGDSIGRLRDAEFAIVIQQSDSQPAFNEALQSVLDAAQSVMPFETDQQAIGFGSWLEHSTKINPEHLIEQLCDGLDEVRHAHAETLVVRCIAHNTNQSAA